MNDVSHHQSLRAALAAARSAVLAAALIAAWMLASCGSGGSETDRRESTAPSAAESQAGGESRDGRREEDTSDSGSPRAFDPQLVSRYAVLRGGGPAAPPPPADLVPEVDRRRLGADPASARFAGRSHGADLFAVAFDGGVCLYGTDRVVGNCWQNDALGSGLGTSAVFCSPYLPPRVAVFAGVAANDFTRAAVVLADGTAVSAPIRRNTFVIMVGRDRARPRQIEVANGVQRIREEAPIGPESWSSGCAEPPR